MRGEAFEGGFPRDFRHGKGSRFVGSLEYGNPRGGVVWQPRLRRATFDWEIPRLIEFLNHLQGVQVNIGEED